MQYEGRTNWGVVELCARTAVQGKFVSHWRTIKTYLGFLIFVIFWIVFFSMIPTVNKRSY